MGRREWRLRKSGAVMRAEVDVLRRYSRFERELEMRGRVRGPWCGRHLSVYDIGG